MTRRETLQGSPDYLEQRRLVLDEARLSDELAQLATYTRPDPEAAPGSVTRIVFSAEDLAARAWLKALALDAGLTVREDAAGNTFIRLVGADTSLPAVATGSHIDAIPHSGRYDGTVGVLGGLQALRAIQQSGVQCRRSIDLILFTSEEPTRFGIGCLGSRLLAGALPPSVDDTMIDRDGKTLRAVRNNAGFAGDLASVRLEPGHYAAFVELHIEQGPILEQQEQQIGIVTGIAAPAGYRFCIEGKGGHAGALLMPDRRDALCAAAEFILAVERHARATGSIDTVATVGTCAVHPGAVNSVPSRVTLELDLRDTDAARRDMVMEGIRSDLEAICKVRLVAIEETKINADAPVTCDSGLVSLIQELCDEQAIASRPMISRAYHDTLFMAAIAPAAMIFIPCHEGISHRPEEFAPSEDIARGALLLAQCLSRLAS